MTHKLLKSKPPVGEEVKEKWDFHAPGESKLLIDIGLSPEESLELRSRLMPFEDDWNAPGMDAYDEL